VRNGLVFVLWPIGKRRNGCVVLTSLHNLQMCVAFIAAFTSKKTMEDDQKKFIPQLAIETEFFHRAFANSCTI
jgi:hypothetical protein